MPKFADATLSQAVQVGGSNLHFSTVRPENLGATEYTLATIVIDESGSVGGFAPELMKALRTALDACRESPRADNLLVRASAFNDDVREIHGFRELEDIDANAYKSFRPKGNTALYDATVEALKATIACAEVMTDQQISCNACVFVITDGDDNRSSETPRDVAQLVNDARLREKLESLQIVLIGVNTQDSGIAQRLELFKKEGKIDRYIDIGNITPQQLASMGDFISSSIVQQSQKLAGKP